MIRRWASEFAWTERIRAHEERLEAVRKSAWEAAEARHAVLWERRSYLALEQAYQDAQLLRRKGRALLDAPITESKRAEDGSVIVRPVRFAIKDAATILLAASTLEQGAISAGLPEDLSIFSDDHLGEIIDVGTQVSTPAPPEMPSGEDERIDGRIVPEAGKGGPEGENQTD